MKRRASGNCLAPVIGETFEDLINGMIGMWKGSCTVDFHFPRTAFLGRYPIPMGFDDVRGIVRILQAPRKHALTGACQTSCARRWDNWFDMPLSARASGGLAR